MKEIFWVFLLSMLPISELRGAIPLGYFLYHLPLFKVFLISISGNIFITLILLLILDKISQFLEKEKNPLKNFWKALLGHYYQKHQKTIEILGELALVIFVAFPLPFTGAWSAALIAFIFNIPFKKAFPLISLGIILAGLIVSFFCLQSQKLI